MILIKDKILGVSIILSNRCKYNVNAFLMNL